MKNIILGGLFALSLMSCSDTIVGTDNLTNEDLHIRGEIAITAGSNDDVGKAKIELEYLKDSDAIINLGDMDSLWLRSSNDSVLLKKSGDRYTGDVTNLTYGDSVHLSLYLASTDQVTSGWIVIPKKIVELDISTWGDDLDVRWYEDNSSDEMKLKYSVSCAGEINNIETEKEVTVDDDGRHDFNLSNFYANEEIILGTCDYEVRAKRYLFGRADDANFRDTFSAKGIVISTVKD